MISPAASGGYGWLIVFLTVAIVELGVVCAAARAARVLATTALLAGILPLGVGFLGALSGKQQVLLITETIKWPEERDFRWGNDRIDACLVFGLASFVLCILVALVALARSSATRVPAGPPAMPS